MAELCDPAARARGAGRALVAAVLLGIVGDTHDAQRLEQRLDAAWRSGEAAQLAPMLAADLELRGAAHVAWVEERYLQESARSSQEVNAALLALSVHGQAGGTIPRERVIEAYRLFMRAHPDVAGYVAPDLAAWRYWDAVSEYSALLKSKQRQQMPSMLAILAYLRQSPSGRAGEALQPQDLPSFRR